MAAPLPVAVLFELPGDTDVWGLVFGPLSLVSLTSLFSLLGALVHWRQERSLVWVIALAPTIVGTLLIAANAEDETAGYIAMGLLLQPLALWAWAPVLRKVVTALVPPLHPPVWLLAVGLVPAVWLASFAYVYVGYTAEANHRRAVLDSLPVPLGAVVVDKSVQPIRVFGDDHISYVAPSPSIEQVVADFYQHLEQEGWERRPGDFFRRDGYCVWVYFDSNGRSYDVNLDDGGDCRAPDY